MLDNRGAALNAIFRIGQRRLRRAFADLDTLQPDVEPRIVHHREHRTHPAHFGTDQPAPAIIIIAIGQDARRRSVDAKLMLDRYAADVIGFGKAAIGRGAELWHEEQRNPFRPRRRAGGPREDEVHDIVGQIMVAEGDVDLSCP